MNNLDDHFADFSELAMKKDRVILGGDDCLGARAYAAPVAPRGAGGRGCQSWFLTGRGDREKTGNRRENPQPPHF